MNDSDAELLARCRAGDQGAWRDLVSRHTRKVFGIAYKFAGRVDEAEDLAQEVFVKVYESLDRYQEPQGSFAAWLSTVARNHAIDHYRRRREERLRRVDEVTRLDAMASGEESPLVAALREERAQMVRRGLRSLPCELREAVILCDLEGLPYEEIASALGVPLGTVKSRINRGRLELARRLRGRRRTEEGA